MLFKWINVLTFQILYLLASGHLNTLRLNPQEIVIVQEPYKNNQQTVISGRDYEADQNEGYQDVRSDAIETVPSDVSY